MATSLTESLKRLMSQHKLVMDVESYNNDLICILCNKIMINAYQTCCGCNYCRECIVAFLADTGTYCPGGKADCKEEKLVLESNVAINPILNKKILRVRVYCPNKTCACITELKEIETHLRVCTQMSMECPLYLIGCENEESSKENILIHLRDDTLSHSQLLMVSIQNMKNEINELKEEFAKSKLEQSREKEAQMEEMRRVMAEEYRKMVKEHKLEMEDKNKETKGLKREIERLKEEYNKREIMMDGMKKEVATLKKEMEEVRECSRNIKNTMETSERESTKYRDETRSTLTKMKEETDKKACVVTVTQSVNDTLARVDKMAWVFKKLKDDMHTNVVSFTLGKFSARKMTEEVIPSPYFYSHTNGYKLRLSACPGGFGDARRTHLSVYIQICRGEYDDVLPWPCRHTFTLSVTNQLGGETHASRMHNYATATDNLKHTFYKPMSKDNVSYGYPNFVSLVDLQSVVGLIVDDSVVVRCVISAPQ